MTRASVNQKLRQFYLAIAMVLVVSFACAFAEYAPELPKIVKTGAQRLYEFLRDMSLLIATLAAAYLANIFQKRANFVKSLQDEWRKILKTKSALSSYCESYDTTVNDYISAYCRISESIDSMRVVYKNYGETEDLIGKYPYNPLHDMRRAFEAIDPRTRFVVPVAERMEAREAIIESFNALRENFLEELDLEEPTQPILVRNSRRLKIPGATSKAQALEMQQAAQQEYAKRRRSRSEATRLNN